MSWKNMIINCKNPKGIQKGIFYETLIWSEPYCLRCWKSQHYTTSEKWSACCNINAKVVCSAVFKYLHSISQYVWRQLLNSCEGVGFYQFVLCENGLASLWKTESVCHCLQSNLIEKHWALGVRQMDTGSKQIKTLNKVRFLVFKKQLL